MIKFFRKIRQKLLAENKFSKYLLYAVGEIILVVIGILIALSINNWNNNRTNTVESNNFNQRLLAEVNNNIDLASGKIEIIKRTLNSSKQILDLFNKPSNNDNLKSLDSLIYYIIEGVEIEFITGTLSEGLNTGKVALIESDILKSKLYGLPSNIEYVGKWDETFSTYLYEIFQPFLYENFNYRKMDNAYSSYNVGPSKFKNQHNKALLESEHFENLINNQFFQSNSQLEFHTNLKNEFEEVKKLIEAELQTEK
jgi:hypothetical protein